MRGVFVVAASLLAAAPAIAETVHGLVLFTRHGDRTSKTYKGYQMTRLGVEQVFQSGSRYRQRYIEEDAPSQILGIAADEYKPSQLFVSAPDQSILLHTATSFLQGLYPPLGDLNTDLASQTLVNGTETDYPLNGYQFVQVHAESDEEPDSMWIKGDDACPAFTKASASYKKSEQYMTTLESSRAFYSQFADILNHTPVAGNVSFAQAFDVFDLLNVGRIHNESVAEAVTPEQLAQLRLLADEWEWGHNYNATEPNRSIGGRTLAGAILKQLNATVASAGKLKLSLMAGSYDTFLAFFGLTDLPTASPDFMGIPDYASSMAVELYTEADVSSFPASEADLRVRYLFHNGSGVAGPQLTAFPLFGQAQLDLPFPEFVQRLSERAINSPAQWCEVCGSDAGFCQQSEYSSQSNNPVGSDSNSRSSSSNSSGGLSPTVAGVVGAMVTLAVLLIGGLALWLLARRNRRRSTRALPPPLEKHASDSGESASKLSA